MLMAYHSIILLGFLFHIRQWNTMLVPDYRKDIELAEEFSIYQKRAEDVQGTLKEITDELRLSQREKDVGEKK